MDQAPFRFQVLEGPSLPPCVRDLPELPRRLYLHGELPRGPAVAIVGTRRPTPAAEAFARELSGELGARGVAILSGGAEGIDSAAHRGALDVGAPTVVVAPAGYERPFPQSLGQFFQEILQHGGGYLSAFAPAEAAALPNFFARNALLVALAQVLVIVEAPFRSGARNAAQKARALGRPVLVVPACPWNGRGLGCIVELQLGGAALLSYRDVLRALNRLQMCPVELPGAVERVLRISQQEPPSSPLASEAPRDARLSGRTSKPSRRKVAAQGWLPLDSGASERGDPLLSSKAAQRIRELLVEGHSSVEALCSLSALPVKEVQNLIVLLELAGELVSDLSGRLSWKGSFSRCSASGTSPGKTR